MATSNPPREPGALFRAFAYAHLGPAAAGRLPPRKCSTSRPARCADGALMVRRMVSTTIYRTPWLYGALTLSGGLTGQPVLSADIV